MTNHYNRDKGDNQTFQPLADGGDCHPRRERIERPMSRGTPQTTVRLAKGIMDKLERQLESLKLYSPRGDWNIAEFLRAAVDEKLKKMARSRKRHKRKS